MVGKKAVTGLEDDDDFVTQVELRAFLKNITKTINVNHASYATQLEGLERRLSGIVDRIEALEIHLPPIVPDDKHEDDDQQDERATRKEQQWRRLQCNRQGMGGNNNRPPPNHDNNDPFAKVKFSIPAFYGAYDAETYLD